MERLTAIQFRRVFTSGRSRPCVVEVESFEGERHEVVLKLKNDLIGREGALARELTASLLATRLGLQAPKPCLVEVTPEFAQSVGNEEIRERLLKNCGLHFATELLSGGWHASPMGEVIPRSLFDPATDVLVFDALIRNDDRHTEKSNYLMRGNEIVLIDHERSFPTAGMETGLLPWEEGGLEFVAKHAFFRGLKGQLPDLDRILGAFANVEETELWAMLAETPDEWETGDVAEELKGYLLALRQHFRSFEHQLKDSLR